MVHPPARRTRERPPRADRPRRLDARPPRRPCPLAGAALHRPDQGRAKRARFDAALELVRAGYEDLIALRDQLSPHTMLVFQGYDFALPDGRGICGFGPWLKPTFDLRKFPTLAAGQAVVKVMLQQFAAMLTSLSGPTVTFINGQGTLSPQPGSWDNELHPEKAGFEKFADLFQAKLKVLFPNRVA